MDKDKIALLQALGIAARAAQPAGIGPDSAYKVLMKEILALLKELRAPTTEEK